MKTIFNNTSKDVEVIVVDGGSSDDTTLIANKFSTKLIQINKKQRAAQLNAGAIIANYDVLVFLHADVLPPKTFQEDIIRAISTGNKCGWFSYKFDQQNPLLNFNSSFTKKNGLFSGAGDQTLFILKKEFDKLGGYDESYEIMEDFKLTRKIKKEKIPYTIITNDCIVSSRKYSTNSWLRVNLANLIAFGMFLTNSNTLTIKKIYKRILNPY